MYLSYLKALLKFDSELLYDPINDMNLDIMGQNSDVLINSSYGYTMKQNQYLRGENLSLDLGEDGFSISFWLYPVNPGMVRNPSTDVVESLRMPLFYIAGSDEYNAETDIPISFYELTNGDDTNYLEIRIDSINAGFGITETLSSAYTVYSDSYSASVFHHFLITVSIEKKEIKIYIDGKESSLNDSIGTIPDTNELIGYFYNIYINRIIESDYAYNIANNYGIIDDIAIFNLELNANSVLSNIINNGISNFVNLTYKYNKYYYSGYLFDDPSTIRINSVVDDMSYVYLACNDGRILRGSPLLWESRKVFSDPKEKTILEDTLVKENGSLAEIQDGFLEIKNSIVRF